MSLFSVSGLTAGYGGKAIVKSLSFSVEKGKLLGILGANGSGKTTLLKALCGILPHEGSCMLDGVQLEKLSARQLARRCSYIPQRSGISIDLSVLDVVLMGFNPQLGLLERPGAAMKERAREALALAGLAGREEDNYQHLSEGQKQLCILARTLAADCSLLLLDEPESALDVRFRSRMLAVLRRWLREGNRCGVVTLHDPSLALNDCDELLLLQDGGQLALLRPALDPPEEMERALSCIYGPVTLTRCSDRRGKSHLVMLKEEEENP